VAAGRGESLALVRPRDIKFSYAKKSQVEIEHEADRYRQAASQCDIFDKPLKELEPCPYRFKFLWADDDGKKHRSECGDWETAAMFYNLRRNYGEATALARMRHVFGEEYPRKGVAFALGTHSRRPDQWLLVGVIRVDESKQVEMLF